VRATLGVWMAIYALASMKTVYGGGWVGIVLRAILIAVVWLKEPFTRTRILAVLLAATAIPLLRLG